MFISVNLADVRSRLATILGSIDGLLVLAERSENDLAAGNPADRIQANDFVFALLALLRVIEQPRHAKTRHKNYDTDATKLLQ